MVNFYDLAYGAGLAAAAPVWLLRGSARRKVLDAFRQRSGKALAVLPPSGASEKRVILVHAVSVGEVNATVALIDQLRLGRPGLRFVVSTTTQTGFDRARQLYANAARPAADVALIRFPLDFSAPVRRVLGTYAPALVVLMELEVWPNFLRHCQRRGVPVVVANGRVTVPAMRRYRLAGPVTRGMFASLAAAAVQDDTYADRFARLGVPRDRLHVLGTMKFDSAELADRIDGADALASAVGLRPGGERVWVCGSTGPGEEAIVLDAYRVLLRAHAGLRLVIVPRHPPRFDEVAALIERVGFSLVRRSRGPAPGPATPPGNPPVVLGDTMGELRAFYSLADVVFVGRSLVDLGPRQHGSDMIEPAALARPVIVGPFTGNFDMPMRLLREAGAVVEIDAPRTLPDAVERLLAGPRDNAGRPAIGARAQSVVRAAQGATRRHVEMILGLLDAAPLSAAPSPRAGPR